MAWFSPPDRREITLLLFCLVVYLLAYNIEISLQLIGVDSVATSGALFSRIGLGKTRALARDGRKPNGWQDALELQIFGDWIWDQGHIAGDSDQQAQKIGTDPQYGAAWASKAQVRQTADDVLGDLSVNQALQQWPDGPPQTKVLKHVPGTCLLAAALLNTGGSTPWCALGYTILDNVFIYRAGIYIVRDDMKDFPPISDIASSSGPGFAQWTLLTRTQAKDLFGDFGGVYVDRSL